MGRPRPLVALAALSTIVLVVACTGTQGDGPTESPPPTAATPTSSPAGDPSLSSAPTTSTPTPTTPTPSPTPDGPHGRLELAGWDQQHSNPTSVELEAVEVDAAGNLLVDIEALNSYHRGQVRLALPDVVATDDLGNTYEFVRIDGEGQERFRLGMDADQRMDGTLAFIGPVDVDATTLDVGFNQSSRQDGPVSGEDDTQGQYPKFYFADVPLPGVGLDAQATRGGSQDDAPTIDVGRTVEPEDWPGIAVTVERIVADGRTVTIDLEVANDYDRTMEFLNRTPILDDGHDSAFYYVDNTSEDPAERRLELTPGDDASVTLAWRGSIHPDAEAFGLTFNALDRGARPERTTAPSIFVGDLPVPRPDTPDD